MGALQLWRALALASMTPVLLSAPARGQGSASSSGYLLVGSDQAPALLGASASYKIVGGLGSGVVPQRAQSTNFVLRGGFPTVVETSTTGRPWLTAATPPNTPLGGRTAHIVQGVELHLGPTTTVKVGGVPASVTSRSATALGITLGVQPEPGYHAIEVTNGGGSAHLNRGFGVRPLLEIERPFDAAGSYGSEIVYRGTQGDFVAWMLALGNSGQKIPLANYGWFFELSFVALTVITVTPVSSPDGVVRLPLPAVQFSRPIHFQGLIIAPSAAYKPGAFTNVVQL